MSVPDVAILTNLRSRVPNLAAAEPSAAFVRWMLRGITVIIFGLATVVGIQFAAAAPAESPVSTSVSHR
jgi:hypothetical protein